MRTILSTILVAAACAVLSTPALARGGGGGGGGGGGHGGGGGGWSGGGALSLFYQAEAEDPRVTHTPAGEPVVVGDWLAPVPGFRLSLLV